MFHLLVNDQLIQLPTSSQDVTLKQRIDFEEMHGIRLMEERKRIAQIKKKKERERNVLLFQMENCFTVLSFFIGAPVEVLKHSEYVDQLCEVYFLHMQNIFDEEEIEHQTRFDWNGETWVLPSSELTPESKMKMKELIYSKEHMRILSENEANVYEQALILAKIFFRKEGEDFNKSFLFEHSERGKLMEELPLLFAFHVMKFYNDFSAYLFDNFAVFWPNKIKSGMNAKKHYAEFGWINFLKTVAKTGAFNMFIPGMNAIECVEESSAFEVLVWTSEDKGAAEAEYLDQKAEADAQERKNRVK